MLQQLPAMDDNRPSGLAISRVELEPEVKDAGGILGNVMIRPVWIQEVQHLT